MSNPVESAKIDRENLGGTDDNGGGNNQQTLVKRKRLTQACDACRKKKVKCSGEKPCNNCTRLGLSCTYLPSTRKRGPRVGLVESLEKRLLQMERLLQPLKEQGLVDEESDSQTPGPTAKKPRLNSTELYSADSFANVADNRLYSNPNSSKQDSQPEECIAHSKDTKSHSDFQSPATRFNSHSEQLHSYYSQSPQSSSSSPQLSTPAEHHSPVMEQTKTCEEPQDETIPLIKAENGDERTLIFFGNTAAVPGFRDVKDLESCHKKVNDMEKTLRKQMSTSTTSEKATPIMTPPPMHVSMLNWQNGHPTRDIVDNLASCFFRHVDNQFPMLHEATFKRQLRQGKVSPFLVLSMCAVSARFSDHPRIKVDPPYLSGERFATLATQMIIPSLDKPSVEHVQDDALQYFLKSIHSTHRAYLWFNKGAKKMAQELGLHKVDDPFSNASNKKDSEQAFIRKETLRRTFWACFMLDRFSACALGRPTLIVEDDCDVRFPCVESIWNNDHPFASPAFGEYFKEDYIKHSTLFNLSTTGIFANFCSIITLLGRVSQHVNRSKPSCALPSWDSNSEFAILESELEEWYLKIAPEYEYSKEKLIIFNSTGSGVLFASTHLFYYAVVVVLNRPNFIALQNDDIPMIHKDFLLRSAERCSTAAKRVTSIATDAIQYGIHYMCPFTLYPVFATATIHVNDSFNEDESVANKAKERLKIHKKYMSDLGPIWAMANKLCWMIEEMCNLRNEQSDPKCSHDAFFFNSKKRTQPRTELMSTSTDAGFMTLWNRTNNSILESNVNNNSTFDASFSDQLSPRWFLNGFNDNSIIGDSLTNFLRSQLPISPGSLIRYNKKDNGENEDDYFSQDMTLYGNNNLSYMYDPAILDMPVGQAIPEWLPGRFIQSNRQTNKQWIDVDPMIQNSVNPIPLPSNVIEHLDRHI
ncbi:15727_t:CDS:2 [Acaulospora colombiana]|uniref:15727_t:CDS:1 n=1 Tax=Acaulospora colombiana TaxID=27376 RepID=A0ACA9K582_9GLOM|nr:15727_t:CDS:2 [Acaulospora colombiana]